MTTIATNRHATAWRGKYGIFGHAMDAKTSAAVIDPATGLPIATAINYMLPDGRDICPAQILAGCKGPCLNTAGRGAMNTMPAEPGGQCGMRHKHSRSPQYRVLSMSKVPAC